MDFLIEVTYDTKTITITNASTLGRERCVCEPEHLLYPKKMLHVGDN